MPLTRQNKQVIDIVESEPATSQTDAYIRVYGTKDRKQANERASRLMNKPESRVYRQEHVDRAKSRIVELMESDNEQIAYKASTDILDRNEGKAIQKTENVSRKVSISIDLTDDKPKFTAQETELLEEANEL